VAPGKWKGDVPPGVPRSKYPNRDRLPGQDIPRGNHQTIIGFWVARSSDQSSPLTWEPAVGFPRLVGPPIRCQTAC
jgi:hypothetical protein